MPARAFDSLDGVHRAEAEGDRVRVTVAGPLDAVIKAAARFEVVDLVSHEPSLEDIFLAFYGREGNPMATEALAARPMLRDVFRKTIRDQRRALDGGGSAG